MKLCWVTISVENLERSLEFYHDLLGLNICSRFKAGDGVEIAMLGEADQPKIELLYNSHHEIANPGTGISIGFEVESLDDAIATVQSKHIPIIKGPLSPTPKTRFFFVNDPNGVEIQLVENK
jgi:lactoylglutathione lyase